MREAATILAPIGIARETTRRVLHAGLAGEPVRAGRALVFRRAAVEELAARPLVEEPPWEEKVAGVFVVRLSTRAAGGPETWHEVVHGPWRISALGRVRLSADVQLHGSVPLVATFGGFVVLGAEITAVRPAARPEGRAVDGCGWGRLETRPAGDWYAGWTGRRTEFSGRQPWWMWPDGLWQPLLEGRWR